MQEVLMTPRSPTLPSNCPAWLAEWIGATTEWQRGIDKKLDKLIHNGKAKSPEEEKTGQFTWKDLGKSILIPILLAINSVVLGIVVAKILGT